MKVLVCGDREWSAWPPIYRELRGLGPAPIVIHGDCRGADKMCGYVAEKKYGYEVRKYPADWNRHGKAAGPIRNQEMLDKERPEMVIAFHTNLAQSKGTKDMVERARSAGVPVRVITE